MSAWRSRLGVATAFAGVLARRAASRVGLAPRRRPLPSWNAMLDQERLPALRRERRLLAAFDLYLAMTVDSPRLRGQILFEYGTLLNWRTDWRGQRILDIGTGRSTLPSWFARRGARVVTFDFPQPVEARIEGWRARLNALLTAAPRGSERAVAGSMLELPFAAGSFDLVSSFSVLEHLDTDLPSRAYVPPAEQQRRLGQALDEMVRVARPGGHLYITSECCRYERATSDEWQNAYYFQGPGAEFSGAWPVDEVGRLFYDHLTARGCTLVGARGFDAANLDGSARFASCRGPFFSAFSVLVRKS